MLSVGILALILLMWTRERMTEVGILISLGISPKAITGQIVLENYYVALPSFLIAALLSFGLSGVLGNAIDGLLQDIKLASYIGPLQLLLVAVCAAVVIAVSVLLASISILRKKPKDVLIDLS